MRRSFALAGGLAVATLVGGACGGRSEDTKSTNVPSGGASGASGTAGTGGASASGGAAGRGGTGGTGGTSGTGGAAGAPICCENGRCPAGYECVGTRCVPEHGVGGCWRNKDCSITEICEGARTCLCEEGCNTIEMGKCVPLPPRCCATDYECADLNVYVPCVENVCKTGALMPSNCWKDQQCGPGMKCLGGFVCPCGTFCEGGDVPGDCFPIPDVDGGPAR